MPFEAFMGHMMKIEENMSFQEQKNLRKDQLLRQQIAATWEAS
jgi:hypothetical protein